MNQISKTKSVFFISIILSNLGFACPEPLFPKQNRTGVYEINSPIVPADSTKTYLEKEEFFDALNKAVDIYNHYLMPAGITMVAEGFWDDLTTNGTVRRVENVWKILIYGGYARSKYVTKDVIARTACHEIGHHFGGTNFYPGAYFWASGEGQSDYYATLKCLRMYFEDEDNKAYLSDKKVPTVVSKLCNESWGKETKDSYICQRSTLAAKDWVAVQNGRLGTIDFATPDSNVVAISSTSHPEKQCRADTMFQGALCNVDHRVATDIDNSEGGYKQGTCTAANGDKIGLRPKCWFSSNDYD